VRFRGLRERPLPINRDVQLPTRDEAEQVACARVDFASVAHVIGEVRASEEDGSGLGELDWLNRAYDAGACAVQDAQSSFFETADAVMNRIAANRIVDDIHAAIVGKTQRCLAKIRLAIENNIVGAALARYRGLVLASDGCENARPAPWPVVSAVGRRHRRRRGSGQHGPVQAQRRNGLDNARLSLAA